MRRTLAVAAVLAFVLTASPGHAHTGALDPLAAELDTVRNTLDPGDPVDAKILKVVDKTLAALGTIVAETPIGTEVKVAGKVAATVAKSLAGLGNLAARMKDASDAYLDIVERARLKLSVAITMMDLPVKTRATLVKTLAAMDKGLAPLTPAASPDFVLKALAKVAKYVTSVPAMPDQVEATWVLNSVSVPPSTEGLDVDGDGTIDNVLGSVVGLLAGTLDINQTLADTLAGATTVLLVQMWWSDADGKVLAGLVNGNDTDGDTADNFSGSESFEVTAGLGGDLHPTVRVETAFAATGAYSLELDAGGISLPGLEFPLPASLPLKMKGTASAAANNGYIGFAVPISVLAAIVTGMGQPDPSAALKLFADVDLDPGIPGNDALSAAMKFTAVPAGIQ